MPMTEPLTWRSLSIPAESDFAWHYTSPALEIVVEKWTSKEHADKPYRAMLSVELMNPVEARGATAQDALELAHTRLRADVQQINASMREAFGA